MWICYDVNNQTCGVGNTPTEAYKALEEYHGYTEFNCCEFYEVDKATDMKQAIIPQEVIVPSTTRSKK